MRKFIIEIKWGLMFFVVTMVWMVFERLMGWHDEHIENHMLYTNYFAIPAILIYILALLDKRKNSFGDSMTWLQGFMTGLLITFVVVLLSPLGQIITHKLISPNYFKNIITYSVDTDLFTLEAAEDYFNLKNYITQSVLGAAGMGVITSAIVAVLIRKK